jgi:hypothetical protein
VPSLFSPLGTIPTYVALGVLGEHAFSVLKYTVDEKVKIPSTTQDAPPALPLVQLVVRTFGNDSEQAQALAFLVKRWDTLGRPNERALHIYAYGHGQSFVPTAQDIVLKRQETQFVFRW